MNKPNLHTIIFNHRSLGTLAMTAIVHRVAAKKLDPQCPQVILPSRSEQERTLAFCRQQARAWKKRAEKLMAKPDNHSPNEYHEACSMANMWAAAETEAYEFMRLIDDIFNPEDIQRAKKRNLPTTSRHVLCPDD